MHRASGFKVIAGLMLVLCVFTACKKSSDSSSGQGTGGGSTQPSSFTFNSLKVNGVFNGYTYKGINTSPVVKISFSAAVNRSSVAGNVVFANASGAAVNYTATYADNDNTIVITPAQSLQNLTKYNITVNTGLQSAANGNLLSGVNVQLTTAIDSTNKFATITDDQLLDLVQKQTFKYFWDFGHPTSGLARERDNSGDVVTTGGSGFGVMAIVAAINRQFISRADGLARMQKIVAFLKNNAQKFHGAFPHWMNGATGVVVPFSTQDNGADLVETSYLMEGLLTARQYFNGTSTDETNLRSDITTLYNNVEWSWFTQGGQNFLTWHWSPNYGFAINMHISGWDEALITYVMAASSSTYGIAKSVYDNGWASNGSMKNGGTFYGVTLPLGPAAGGPLFFEHYSFMGINPKSLTDAYANYQTQTVNHTMINYNYCVANPNGFAGYSADCWGLTASDTFNGYNANSPTSDGGVIAPTAAISSLPYTPTQSLAALHFFYYKLGDKLWNTYGFYDSFSLDNPYFSGTYLAIDQGPEIVMIENYRSSLLWNLFMSCPEVKTGMRSLGFSSPNL